MGEQKTISVDQPKVIDMASKLEEALHKAGESCYLAEIELAKMKVQVPTDSDGDQVADMFMLKLTFVKRTSILELPEGEKLRDSHILQLPLVKGAGIGLVAYALEAIGSALARDLYDKCGMEDGELVEEGEDGSD